MPETLRISEIFGPTIQGEGALIGKPTLFVRTGGCDYRCLWCDTPYAVDSEYRATWKEYNIDDILKTLDEKSGHTPMLVTLSGGNPAIQDLEPLLLKGREKGYQFALETQGSIPQKWFRYIDILTLSPKPPSSGMETDWDKLSASIAHAGDKTTITLKIVIFDDADYVYAKNVHERYPDLDLYLQVGNHKITGDVDSDGLNKRLTWLIERVNADKWFTPYILPQLHVSIWGNQRGV